jgi:hypothetical protein
MNSQTLSDIELDLVCGREVDGYTYCAFGPNGHQSGLYPQGTECGMSIGDAVIMGAIAGAQKAAPPPK